MPILHEAEQSERRYIPCGLGVGHVPYSLDLAHPDLHCPRRSLHQYRVQRALGFCSNHNRRPITHRSDQITVQATRGHQQDHRPACVPNSGNHIVGQVCQILRMGNQLPRALEGTSESRNSQNPGSSGHQKRYQCRTHVHALTCM
jgi:hypothetical protein